MKGHVKKCVERYCELANKIDRAIVQSLNSLLGRSSLQGGGNGISWRTVKSMLTDCLEMFVFGTNWKTWHFPCTPVSCVTVSSLHLRTLPQGPWVSSKTVLSHSSSHRIPPIGALRSLTTFVAELSYCSFRWSTTSGLYASYSSKTRLLLPSSEQDLFATEWSISFRLIVARDAAGNHAETRTGAYINYGGAASLHGWEFRTRLRTAGKKWWSPHRRDVQSLRRTAWWPTRRGTRSWLR